ncbi:MAG: 2-hydroxyacid dehydrogenase [Bdellovibrionales bacterium]|nr:2-hydroxyacid dehydrogenase [Oligoflexia bacterium]
MKIAVFNSHPYDREFLNQANQEFQFELTYHEVRLNQDTAELARGFDAVCVFVNDCVDEKTLTILKTLQVKTVALRCAGFDQVDLKAADSLGIRIVRVPSYSPHSIAEHAVALILGLNRKLCQAHDRVREGNYSLQGLLGFELRGKTVGVIGTGAIGSAFAQIMRGFGCKLLAYDVIPNEKLANELKIEYLSLDDLLQHSDMVSLHLPLNAANRNFFDARCFEKMKRGALFINTSRGPLVDTHALIQSLKSGKLGYAGLDVYDKEAEHFFCDQSDQILQDDALSRLLSFKNVLITPHQAFFTREALTEIAHTTLSNIKGGLATESSEVHFG